MFKNILVPLDGSSFGESAISMAVAIAQVEGAGLRLLHVVEPITAYPFIDPEMLVDGREAIGKYMEALAEKLREDTSVEVSTSVREGTVETEIMAEAERAADLVVMATHGRGAASRFWLGSVADACIRGSEIPVLLVRPGTEEGSRAPIVDVSSIVIPLDGSPLAESALPIGEYLSRTLAVPLHVVHSVAYLAGFSVDYMGAAWSSTASAQGLEWAIKYLDGKVAELRDRGLEPLPHVVTDQHPPKAILDVAGADGLVVMATHGTGGIGRAVLGSVTDKVVRGAAGPVLVVRSPKPRKAKKPRRSAKRARATWPPTAHGP